MQHFPPNLSWTDRGGGAAGGSSNLARGRQSFGERTTTLLQGAAEELGVFSCTDLDLTGSFSGNTLPLKQTTSNIAGSGKNKTEQATVMMREQMVKIVYP